MSEPQNTGRQVDNTRKDAVWTFNGVLKEVFSFNYKVKNENLTFTVVLCEMICSKAGLSKRGNEVELGATFKTLQLRTPSGNLVDWEIEFGGEVGTVRVQFPFKRDTVRM